MKNAFGRVAVGAASARHLVLLSASVVALSAQQAQAQIEAQAENDGALATIVVTAQKRSENLQSVPLAVTAVSGDQLEAMNIRSARDLTTAVPGLIYSQAGGTTQTFLRGIGTTITQVNADPSVATYIDGVYISLATVSSVKLSDIQAVEVLKGPQGTLYGRNATGGAVSITTKNPSHDFGGQLSAGYGNYDRREFSGSVSGKLAENLYMGVYGSYEARDQYSKLENLGGVARPSVRGYDFQWSARTKIVYDNDVDLKIILSGDISKYGSLQDMAWRQLQPDAEGYGTSTIGPKAIANPGLYSFSTNAPVDNRWLAKGGSLRAEYKTGGIKLVSITAYRDNYSFTNADGDATEAAVAATVVALDNFSKQTTQELQIESDNSSPLQWIVGGYYYKDKGLLAPFHIQPLPFDQQITAGANTTSYSGYGQLTWKPVEALGITIGGRYTDETKDYTGGTSVNVTTSTGATTTTTFAPRSTHYTKFNPKVGVEYHFGDAMLYGSYSQAFKSGVYNLNGTSNLAIGPVNPEQLNAYELGIKSELFDRRVRLNVSYFHYDFKDLQVQTIDKNGISSLQNAAKAHSNGVDIDALWAVTPRFQLSAKMLYLDAKYDSFPSFQGKFSRNANTVGGSTRGGNIDVPGGVDLTGKTSARSPKFTGSFGATYNLPLDNGATVAFSGNLYHSSSYAFNPDATVTQAAYTTVDASLEYTASDGKWSASVWAKNIGGAYYYAYKQINGNGTYGIPAAPATFGVTLGMKFGNP